MTYLPLETIQFASGMRAPALLTPLNTPPDHVLTALAIPQPRAVLVLNGGTAALEEPLKGQLQNQIANGLARLAAEEQITIVTGGSDAGVFALLGTGLQTWGCSAACIGVAVEPLAQRPGHPDGEATLESHHTHFVLMRGQHWGDETQMMYALIATLATYCPSIAVFAGGGQIVISEMEANIKQGRRMILLAGSGRTTDAVLAIRSGAPTDNERLRQIARSDLIVPFPLSASPHVFAERIKVLLFGHLSDNPAYNPPQREVPMK